VDSQQYIGNKLLNILLIDESPDGARRLAGMLSRAKESVFAVRHTAQLAEGLRIVADGGIDVVMMAWPVLRDKDPKTLLKLRGKPPYAAVIVISGQEDEGVARAAARGARDCLITEYINDDGLERSVRYAYQFERMEQALAEVEHMKNEFISGLSHELRVPLHSIQGFTQLLLEGAVSDAVTRDEFLNIINQQSDRLRSQIDILLDASCLAPGQFSVEKQRVPFYNILRNAIEDAKLSALEKDISIKEDINAALVEIKADKTRMRQVITHLLLNAVKFSEGGTQIVISAAAKDRELEISIKDEGIGIPEESLPYIFQRFYQVKNRRRVNGVGMGLYFSQQVIQAHGGNIRAESRLGEGCNLIFTLPLPEAQPGGGC